MARKPHNRQLREQAKEALHYPAVKFTGLQAKTIGEGFAESARKGKVEVWACSIMPEHVHMVLARHTSKAEILVNFMKGAATRKLIDRKMHPLATWEADGETPTCWAHRCWKVFLDSDEDILRAIKYVEGNPEKEGKRRQTWSFVTPFSRSLMRARTGRDL